MADSVSAQSFASPDFTVADGVQLLFASTDGSTRAGGSEYGFVVGSVGSARSIARTAPTSQSSKTSRVSRVRFASYALLNSFAHAAYLKRFASFAVLKRFGGAPGQEHVVFAQRFAGPQQDFGYSTI